MRYHIPIPPALLPGIPMLLLLVACHPDEVQRYRIPKEAARSTLGAPALGFPAMESPAPGTPGMDPASVPPPPGPEARGSLKWTLPPGWSSSGSSGMRFATLKPATAGRLDISVVVLSGPAGGELANVNRWRGQIGLPPIDEPSLAAQRQIIRSRAGEVAVFDFTGPAQAKTRMVVGLLQAPDGNTWFLKMTGDEEPAGRAKPDFLKWMGSLRLD